MSSEVTSIDPSLTLSLRPPDDDDDLNETWAYRLVKIGKDVLVYGDDSGQLLRAQDQKMVRRWGDDALRAIAVSPNQRTVVVGFETGEVQIYKFADYEPCQSDVHPFCEPPVDDSDDSALFLSQSDKLLSPLSSDKMHVGPQADTTVRHLLFLDDELLAIATESGLTVVKVTDVDNEMTFLTKEVKKEHRGSGIRGLSWDKTNQILTTLAMDGGVMYWKCPLSNPEEWKLWRKEEDFQVLKKDVGEALGSDHWDRSTRPWQHDGVLAIPGSNFWQLAEFSSNPHLQRVELCQTDTVHKKNMVLIRSNKSHWITTDRAGEIVLWQLKSKQMMEKNRLNGGTGEAPTDALWTDEKLWVISADGRLLVWETDDLPKDTSNEAEVKESISTEDHMEDDKVDASVSAKASGRKKLIKPGASDKIDDDDDDDIDFPQSSVNPFIEDQAAEDNDDEAIVEDNPLEHSAREAEASMVDRDDGDDDDDDDENSFEMDHFPASSNHTAPTWTAPAVEPQAAFGPSSTPLEDPRRFLCWNQVGALSVRQTDLGRSTVDIDFTDSAFRRPVSFTDTIGFILGSIGEDGAILASDIPDDDDDEDHDIGEVVDGLKISETTKAALKKSRKKDTNGSTIYFHRFETFASNRDKDWYLTLPAGERVLGCATGEGWAAVATHRRFVRFFSTGGNQGQILWIDGDPVTMVGRSRFLAVVYHQSSPLFDGTQKLGYTLFDAVESRVVTKGSLSCLSSRASLQWVGFSSELSLMAMDSDGMLSMLVSSAEITANWEWTPVLDTMALRKSTEDTHWPIHVSAGKLICVPLKGGLKYPDVARRPVTTALGMRLPMARGPLTQTHMLEELSVRAAVALHQRKAIQRVMYPGEEDADDEFNKEYHTLSLQVDKVTLKMFAAVVEAAKLERALDLVERLHLERSFEVALKIASRHRKLADLIEEARDRKFPVDDADEDDEYSAGSPPEVTALPRAYSNITPDAESGRNPKRSFNSWAGDEGRKARRVGEA